MLDQSTVEDPPLDLIYLKKEPTPPLEFTKLVPCQGMHLG